MNQAKAQKIYRQMSRDAAVNSIHVAARKHAKEEAEQEARSKRRTDTGTSPRKKIKLRKLFFPG